MSDHVNEHQTSANDYPEEQALENIILGVDTSYMELVKLARKLKKEPALISKRDRLPQTRIALIGNTTLSFLQPALELFLVQRGIAADFFTGNFGSYSQEILDARSNLYTFEPQIVVILIDYHAIQSFPEIGASLNQSQELIDRQIEEWRIQWDKIHEQCSATIIQSNIALPYERSAGHYESKADWGKTRYLRQLNQNLATSAPDFVHICDVEHLSGVLGKRIWFDVAVWYNTHQGFGFKAIPLLTHSLAAIIAATLGKSKKCLVLDLDNTLWGGVVGDVGTEGICLGYGDPVGEAYIDFQLYCRQLKQRGVLLAVCSKNTPESARSPFESHPDMVLKLEDFCSFVANWNDKVTNLQTIASQLNIGMDSIVFIDDNPSERALVRQFLPEIAVPELPSDPALYRQTLDEHAFFETVALSREDQDRSNYYLAERKRQEFAQSTLNIEAFLGSLQQHCTCGPFDEINLTRIVQLLNKTNQWNLTTMRLTEGEVRDRITDSDYYTLWVRHKDRFGDSGLVSTILARQTGTVLSIENWVMSCRVFNRGIEDFVFNELLDEARRRDVTTIQGTYRPTPKNALVADLYSNYGFRRCVMNDKGESQWELSDIENVKYRSHTIQKDIYLLHNGGKDQE